jgi:hypothetical protein
MCTASAREREADRSLLHLPRRHRRL